MKTTLIVGDKVKCIIDKALSSSDYGPNVELNKEYEIKEIITTRNDCDHIDVGIRSELGSVSCLETGDLIPRGNVIAWCHPSRFELV